MLKLKKTMIASTILMALTATGCSSTSSTPNQPKPDNTLPANPDAPIAGLPDNTLPANPDAPIVGLPDNTLPANPDAPIVGLPDNTLPANPDAPIVGLPDAPIEGVKPDAPIVGLPDNTLPANPDAPIVGLPDAPIEGVEPDAPIVGLPDNSLPGFDFNGKVQISTIEINGTTYMSGFITGVGENARYVNVVGFGRDGNNGIKLVGSEGNDVSVIMHNGEITELKVNGKIINKDALNDKGRLPVADAPIVGLPDNSLPGFDFNGEVQISTIEINGTTYMSGFITGVGENARYVNVVGFGRDGNNGIKLVGSEGNDVSVIMHNGEITELKVNGKIINKDALNDKGRLPVEDAPIVGLPDNSIPIEGEQSPIERAYFDMETNSLMVDGKVAYTFDAHYFYTPQGDTVGSWEKKGDTRVFYVATDSGEQAYFHVTNTGSIVKLDGSNITGDNVRNDSVIVDRENQTISINGNLFYATEGNELVNADGKRVALISKDENNYYTIHNLQGDLLATYQGKIGLGHKVVHSNGAVSIIRNGKAFTISPDMRSKFKARLIRK